MRAIKYLENNGGNNGIFSARGRDLLTLLSIIILSSSLFL